MGLEVFSWCIKNKSSSSLPFALQKIENKNLWIHNNYTILGGFQLPRFLIKDMRTSELIKSNEKKGWLYINEIKSR